MKIIILLLFIGLACSTRMKDQPYYCVNNFTQILDPICDDYEFDCDICFTEAYLYQCVTIAGGVLAECQDCVNLCEDAYCIGLRDKCFDCYFKWQNCSCPQGMALKTYTNGTRQCELLECPPETYRKYPLCTECPPCLDKCASCSQSPDHCHSCDAGYCFIEDEFLCTTFEDYNCPPPLVKYKNGQGCPTCIQDCPEGFYEENQTCYECPDECATCNSPTDCTTCENPYCLYDGACVIKEQFTCPSPLFMLDVGDCFLCVPCGLCTFGTFCNEQTHTCDSDCTYPPSFIYQTQCINQCPTGTLTIIKEQWGVLLPNTNPLVGWTSNVQIITTLIEGEAIVDGVVQQVSEVIVGGRGQFGSNTYLDKTYTNLQQHDTLILSFQLFLIDTWDWCDTWYHDLFEVLFDGVMVGSFKRFETEKCFDRANDIYIFIINVQIEVQHSAAGINIKLFGKANQGPTDESWGVNNLKLTIIKNNVPQFLIYGEGVNPNQCVPCHYCPQDQYCNLIDYTCAICPAPKFIFNRQCLDVCPPPLFRDEFDNCIPVCPDGQFANAANRLCEPCQFPCITCVDEATKCLPPCDIGFVFLNNECLIECPPNYFYAQLDPAHIEYFCNIATEECQCKPCHATCSQCVGPHIDDCVVCADPSLLLIDGRCVQNCPEGHYPDTVEKVCNCCDESCKSCYGPLMNQCESCRDEDIIFDHICYPKSAISLIQLQMNNQHHLRK